MGSKMNEIQFKLEKKIYEKKFIDVTIEEFKEICHISYINDDYQLKLSLINQEYDIEEIKNEFINYVFQIIKENLNQEIKISKKINENELENQILNNFKYNYYRFEKFNDKYLVSNDTGSWVFLDNNEYSTLKNREVVLNSNLFHKLRDGGIILDKNNLNTEIKKCRSKKDFLFQGPSLHIIVLTLRCNLKCVYCHASSKPITEMEYDLNKDNARKIVDLIFQSPSKSITIEFQGGEPLLNLDILKYITIYSIEKNKILKKDLKLSLVSNLTNMTEDILDFLIEHNVNICTSLDGPKEVHDQNRQLYDKSTEWIKNIQKKYKQNNSKQELNSLLTITRKSLSYSKEIIDEYLKQGFDTIFYRLLNNLGDAQKNKDNIYYSIEEYVKFWEKSMEYILELNKKGIEFKDVKTSIILKKLYNEHDPNYCELRSPCGAVTGQLLYHYDGSVYTCDEGRMIDEDLFKIGTVDDSYTKLTTSPGACSIITASINDTHHCDKCVFKPFCGLCPVINYAMSGSIIDNVANSGWCKIHKAQFRYIFNKIKDSKENELIFKKWINK